MLILLSYCSKNNFNSYGQSVKAEPQILKESGDFLSEIKRLKHLAIPKDSHLYQPPTSNELQKFRLLANVLMNQDTQAALEQADELNYELVEFTDISSKQVLYGLREKQGRNHQLRGWGSYFINPSYRSNALLEVPHIIYDQFSEEIGAKVFLRSAARGLAIAGAHRHANGFNTADVCDPIASIFQEVHQAWVSTQAKTWQIHGFQLSNQPSFPEDTQAVLSNGRGDLSTEILDLNQRMQGSKFQAYVYNRLSVSGRVFSPLGATQNVQGIYCARVEAEFVHIELEKEIRYGASDRNRIAQVIADSVRAVAQ
jgi:hypothetical protein